MGIIWRRFFSARPQLQPPPLVDPENNDFGLLPGSPAIDAGIDVGFPYEGQAPDIGTYEKTGN